MVKDVFYAVIWGTFLEVKHELSVDFQLGNSLHVFDDLTIIIASVRTASTNPLHKKRKLQYRYVHLMFAVTVDSF